MLASAAVSVTHYNACVWTLVERRSGWALGALGSSLLLPQLTPIERYAMKFLEASLEEVTREELKQAEVSSSGGGKLLLSATLSC